MLGIRLYSPSFKDVACVVISVVFRRVFIICPLQQMYVLFMRRYFWDWPQGVLWPWPLPWVCHWVLLCGCSCWEGPVSKQTPEKWSLLINSTLARFTICRACFARMRVHVGLHTKSKFQAPALVSFVYGLSNLLVPQFLLWRLEWVWWLFWADSRVLASATPSCMFWGAPSDFKFAFSNSSLIVPSCRPKTDLLQHISSVSRELPIDPV